MEAVKRPSAVYPYPLDDFLIEVIEQLFMSLGLGLSNIAFKVLLELIELETDLLRRPALLVYRNNALLEIDARLDRSKYLVASTKDSIEQSLNFSSKS